MWENLVTKNKGFRFVHIWIFLSVPYYLVVEKISIGHFFFFFDWATEWALIWQGLMGLARAGLGCRSWPAGQVRVRVWKNPAQTRPVAIPISSFDSVLNFSQGLENASFDASNRQKWTLASSLLLLFKILTKLECVWLPRKLGKHK